MHKAKKKKKKPFVTAASSLIIMQQCEGDQAKKRYKVPSLIGCKIYYVWKLKPFLVLVGQTCWCTINIILNVWLSFCKNLQFWMNSIPVVLKAAPRTFQGQKANKQPQCVYCHKFLLYLRLLCCLMWKKSWDFPVKTSIILGKMYIHCESNKKYYSTEFLRIGFFWFISCKCIWEKNLDM